ncbi:MAG: hypothetical protein P8104_00565 [Gammaproteobacteria bacterium]
MSFQNADALHRELSWSALNSAALGFINADWIECSRHPELIKCLSQSRRTRAYAVHQLFQDFQLKPLSDQSSVHFPANILQRGPTFVRNFVFHVGMIGYSEIVRRSIDGRFKRHFWELVGESGYRFVSKRAALYNPGLMVRFVPTPQAGTGLVTENDIVLVGFRIVSVVLKSCGDDEVVRRANLMFSVSIIEACRQCEDINVDARELSILTRMLLKLLTELDGKP